jgi:hypothetical protein
VASSAAAIRSNPLMIARSYAVSLNAHRESWCVWCREQCLRLIAGSHEREQANATMNQKNILPYDGFAYLVNETSGELKWPEITACLAEIIPWRIETARLFGRDMSVPRMTA